jgi:phosphopantothenoylcysteine decarboxylase
MYTDASDEWREWKVLGDPVMHIRLRSWADLLLVAPLSAHSLAKFRHGLCDDALSSVVRAWNFHKPIILAPAMNTAMWDHPLTREQLEAIQKFSPQPETVTVVDPTVKTLACGDVGKGALAPVDDIIAQVQKVVTTLASAKRQKVQLS